MATFTEDQAVETTADMTAEVRTGANYIALEIPTGTAATVKTPNILPEAVGTEVALVEFSFDLTAVQMKVRKSVPVDQLTDAT